MKLNGYSVKIVGSPDPVHQKDGYVKMQHGQQYKLRLTNRNTSRCNATVHIDGHEVGCFRINGTSSITLERPVDVAKKFTFYLTETSEGRQAGLQSGNSDNGLISVAFIPESKPLVAYGMQERGMQERGMQERGMQERGMMAKAGACFCNNSSMSNSFGYSEGGTGLQGHSDQNYGTANHMQLDHAGKTVINLRLVGSATNHMNDITPLGSGISQTPVPSPVGHSQYDPLQPSPWRWPSGHL